MLLAQALFGKPQALLLDEPTNNLDLDSIRWLERFLCSPTRACWSTISHDRHFLNAICTHIADIDYQTIITYTGGYDDMVMAKSSGALRVESENAEKQKKIAQLQDFVARFSAGTRASQVQSRKKAMEKLQLDRPQAQQHRAAVHPLRAEAPLAASRRCWSRASPSAGPA